MEQKDERSDYAPWELEKKTGKERQERKGIPVANRKAAVSSKPKLKDHDFLEMYVLSREKERLEKYGKTLGRRVKPIASTWKDVKAKMYRLHMTTTRVNKEGIEDYMENEQKRKTNPQKTHKKTQKMDWEY